MCGTKEILWKNVRDKGNPIEKCAGPSPGPRKSWKKPHNLSPIPWTSGNPGKNLTICGPSPGPPEILEKNLTILRICLLVGWLFRQAVQRPPAGANIGAESSDRLLSMHTEDYKYEATLSVIHVQLVESDTHFRMFKLENRIFRLNDACPMRQSLSSQLKTHFCTKHAFFVTEKRILQDFLTLNLGGTFRSWSRTDAIHRAVLVDALRGTAHGQEETVRHLAYRAAAPAGPAGPAGEGATA